MQEKPRASEANASKFSVVTFNTFTGPPNGITDMARFRAQASMFRQEAADVYCLQEVFSEAVVNLWKQELGAEYHFIRGTTGKAMELLSYAAQISLWAVAALVLFLLRTVLLHLGVQPFLVVFCICSGAMPVIWMASRLTKLVSWSFAFGQTSGGLLMLCRQDSVKVVSYEYCPFDEQTGDFLNMVRQRGYLRACLSVRDSPVVVANLHADAFPTVSLRNAAPAPSPSRARQIQQVFREADYLSKEGLFVITGDFNSDLAHDEIPAAEHAARNVFGDESYISIPLTPMLQEVFPETKGDLCMDYQFSKGLAVEKAQVLHTGDLSDHLPVKATFVFP